MTGSVTCSLLAVAAVGIWFPATRGFALAAIALLVFMFTWLVVLILCGSAAVFYWFRIRK